MKHLVQTTLLSLVDSVAAREGQLRPQTLLVVHLDAIGDYILVRNFIRLLKTSDRFRGYRITLCGNTIYRELAESLDSDVIDDFIWIDRNRFRYNLTYRFRLVRDISGRGFETAIHPAYSRIFYWGDSVVKVCGARERVGSSGDTTNMRGWQKRLSDSFYTRLIPAGGKTLFEFYRNREFFEALLGVPLELGKPVLECGGASGRHIPEGRYAVLFPGAGEEFRQWGAGNFARVADYVTARYGLTAIVAGSPGEKGLAARITAQAKTAKVVDLAGKTSLSELARLISGAALLVANETSAVHMAAAVGTRVVCISNGNQLGRFSPYPAAVYGKALYVYPEPIRSSPADFDALCERYRVRSSLDIDTISVGEVQEAIDHVLI
ncbi:glycosyltransferase family 9 protein [Geobacter sp. FeAm09]|uniref:glycosyltransferase family 9 protein n=1 Tax=Geobacter sp. FeAm09 TaxID=2597769 RepID=UPI0011EF7E88|nr:glycosyltransferase family 9 protein [Geobacter sp. FeAm09]QEM69128.1 glycosyltransferase family 9 protein [Geobacter sp. FeAm09]